MVPKAIETSVPTPDTLETAHAFHYALHVPSDSDRDVMCLSGRGDKDLATLGLAEAAAAATDR